MYIYIWTLENGTNEPICRAVIETDIDNRLVDTGGEAGTNLESGIDIYTIVVVVSNSCDSMDCSPQGSSVHGISQARILEWVAISFSTGSA